MSVIGSELRVVPAGLQDAARIADVHGRLFEEAWDRAGIAGLLDHPAALTLLAMSSDDDAVAGFVIAHVAADEAEVLSLGVAPERQRRGVARLLLRELAAAAAARGARRLYVDVAADNRPALMLYAGLGIVEQGRRTGYYVRRAAPASDALLLARAL